MKIATVPARGAIAVLVGLLLVANVGASDAQGGIYVAHVRALVEAVGAGNFEAFESRFAKKVRGLQPDELWEGAQTLVTRFGEIQDVALASLDEDSGGAFVKVTFAQAEREVFVRLGEDERIRQLTYVPPDVD
jgi:hypothetical protein